MAEEEQKEELSLMEMASEQNQTEASEEGEMQHATATTVEGEEIDNVEFARPDYYPEQFWDETEGPDVEGLAKAYSELRTKMSRGDHKTPESYDISSLENVAEDDPILTKFTEWSKENGITQAAFEDLAKSFIEAGYQSPEAIEAQEQINAQEEMKKLGPNGQALVNSNLAYFQGLQNKGIINEEHMEEVKILGATAMGQQLMSILRGVSGEKEIPTVSLAGQAPDKDALNAMVADPRYRDDPVYRANVVKTFQEVYPDG